MGILDANAEDLGIAAANSRTLPPPKAIPGLFTGFAEGTGRYFMRSMAEAGRGLSMAFGAIPVALQAGVDAADKLPGPKSSGRRLDDAYFRWHDETFNNAIETWTPKPEEVGAAGQVVGTLTGGVVQFLANPALMINSAQMGTGEDLVRQGVDSGASLVAGDIAGLGAVFGIKLPLLGSNLASRLALGAAGNVGQGVAQTAATREVLKAAEASPEVLKQYETWDMRNRTVDALMGLAFGAVGHVGAKPEMRDANLTPTQRDAIALVNQSRHLEEASSPGRPADLARSVDRMKTAIDQMLRGEPVSVETVPRETPDLVKAQERAEIAQVVEENVPVEAPIARPEMAGPVVAEAPPAGEGATAPPPRFADDVMMPSGEFDAKTGEPRAITANEHVANAHADAAGTKATARNLMVTAAECLLGNL